MKRRETNKGLQLLYTLDKIEISVQVFEGLDTNEADQLYIDLNTKSKKVALSKRISFDSRNEINQTTNEVLHGNRLLKEAGVEQEKRAVMRPKNKNFVSLSQLRQLVAYFITGKRISSSLAFKAEMTSQNDENIALINVWFEEVFKLHPVKTIGNYEVSMLASFPLLYAVAVYASEGLEEESVEGKAQTIVSRMQHLKKVNWARSKPEWRKFKGSERGREKYYYLANDKKNIEALISWLRRQGGG
ncbi:DNA sulfur modification protein DndB [Sporosarcina sp. G11-34]|uniref:DNA sulfur modification protein DndB n=1 Tax=Sporosarcina sp. G11-34 TaxID=2849605 RepID=UPI0022A95ADC|nr:DNA sulfur modification protein DndB [Sporosarcina sp. G11-34]